MATSVFALLFLFLLPTESTFTFEDCGNGDSIVRLHQLRISPDPIDLIRRNVTVTARGEILRDVPDSARLEVRYYKIRKVFGMQMDIPIPCIVGKFGSCTLPLCDYMDRFAAQVCPFFSKEIACECPLKTGSYGGENVEVELAETSVVGRFIARGKYRAEMRMKDGDAELACFIFHMELV